jgi:NAD(P)-dependent dehydrogenase (short-subunit alcohol dehydrogenase family)
MDGKVVVITGALGALGRVVVDEALARGARIASVSIMRRRKPRPRQILFELGGVDLTDAAHARKAIDAAAAHFGKLDALINIAGGFAFETVADGDPRTWQRMYALNVMTALNAPARAAIPHLISLNRPGTGNIGAMGALQAGNGMGAYAASKAGVHRLTEAPRRRTQRARSRSTPLPSTIDTAANRASMPKADFTKWVAPKELADVILFLASDAASAVTGALLPVNGRV